MNYKSKDNNVVYKHKVSIPITQEIVNDNKVNLNTIFASVIVQWKDVFEKELLATDYIFTGSGK